MLSLAVANTMTATAGTYRAHSSSAAHLVTIDILSHKFIINMCLQQAMQGSLKRRMRTTVVETIDQLRLA